MTTNNTVSNITATNATPSTCCDTAGAMDIDVSCEVGGRRINGAVTLVPAAYDGKLSGWGSADNWVSGALLQSLRSLSADDLRDALQEIEYVAAAAARF